MAVVAPSSGLVDSKNWAVHVMLLTSLDLVADQN